MSVPNKLAQALGINSPTLIRGPVNPADLATIFSIYPQEVVEVKHTVMPSIYRIPSGTKDNPSRLVVGTGSWWRQLNPDEPLLEIPCGATQIAGAVVDDYNSSRIGVNVGNAVPGLFYLPGNISVDVLRKDFTAELVKAVDKQLNWFKELVRMGDSLWARTNGNPISIDDTMKLAAKELGQQREWLRVTQRMDMIACVACGNLRNPTYPICPHCKAVVDKDKAKELGLQFVA